LPGISNAEKRTLRRSCPVPDRRLPIVPPILLDALNRPIPQADTHPDVTPVSVWTELPERCPEPVLMTIGEVAAALRVCTKTVRSRIKDGTIRAPELTPDSPYAPLLAVADEFQLATVRRFAARMMQAGRHPGDVTDDDLKQYGTFLATQMVAVKIEPTLRRIVQLWRRTAASHPDWPQIPPKLDGEAKPFNPPFSAYPVSLQNEI
jgi:hypothetical protein